MKSLAMRSLVLGVISVCAAVIPAGAQKRPRPSTAPRPAVTAPRPDTTKGAKRPGAPGDTTATGELVKWTEPDSMMQKLMAVPGYSATRYQGQSVLFDAKQHRIVIAAPPGSRSAVSREQSVLVADTLIYNDSTNVVVARAAPGDTIVLRDPTQNAADVVARDSLRYNIAQRQGMITNISTSVEAGQRWYVQGREGFFVGDTVRQETRFYALDGTITSCDEAVPDYYFRAKQMKVINKKVLVARPAVLYIADIPVFWLPFIFQDLRSGRRSGMLTPRFGVSELFRNSPTYRRHVENIGYYFAISDYMDAQIALDWRSGARASVSDPGWLRVDGEWRYRWLDRFMTGRVAASQHAQRDGQRSTNFSWSHNQEFSQRTRFNADVNYTTNTAVQRQSQFNPYAVMATIRSQGQFSTARGPFQLALGGTQTQYPGRPQVDRTFPTLNISSRTIALRPWLDWTPSFSFNQNSQLHQDLGAGEFAYRFVTRGTGLDSTRLERNGRVRTMSFGTPLKIGDFNWRNSFTLTDNAAEYPQLFRLPKDTTIGGRDTTIFHERVFARSFRSDLDWQTGFELPRAFQGSWNLTPTIAIVNADAGAPYWVRSNLTNGRFIHQGKRLQYGVSAAPTFFGLFRGIGPVSRIRHSVSPSVTYNYAPKAKVSDEFLAALGRARGAELTGLAQNQITLNLQQNLEAKLRSATDTAPEGGRKIRVLSLNFTPLSYDFERVAELRRRARAEGKARPSGAAGFATDRFGYTLRSDLLPGFDFGSTYSLFEGALTSDTARFAPYREEISARFSLSRSSNIFAAFARVFGRAVPARTPQVEQAQPTPDDALARQVASMPVAGSMSRNAQFSVPHGAGWQMSLSLTSNRRRPPRGGNVETIDPTSLCQQYVNNTFAYQDCVTQAQNRTANDFGGVQTIGGGTILRVPPQTSVQTSLSFNVTPKWSAQWNTTYDAEKKEFASHIVTLQRELHDWRAIWAFTQAPNGNFAFSFFISLNAEPEIKFNYDKQTVRPLSGSSFRQ